MQLILQFAGAVSHRRGCASMLGAKKVAQLTGCIYQCIVCRFNCKSQWVASSIAINMIYSMAFITLMIITLTSARTDDWATYMHDVARTGITLEQLELPLSEQWVFISKHPPQPAWEPPKPAPIEGILEVNRLCFDDAYQVAVVGEWVYFGSSADSKVYCLNASTGEVRWTFFTGGPVRFAPTVWRGRVFVGSDDGYVYCLRATDGKLLWKFKAAPSDEKVLGNGKMISLWPVRTGVLVYDGIAYFGAGIFPSEGVYLYAVRAKDGKLIWKNDSWGYSLSGWRSRSPQGYLLAAANRLFVPCGRALPA
ncbi:MAG TPA: hypothetical protein EYP10_09225, partial [Armatimonadetes bacterium]|nr:hypothetical protein [Armatimonadota bacterium]